MTIKNETPAAARTAGRGDGDAGGTPNGNPTRTGVQLVTRTLLDGPIAVVAQCGGAISAARVEGGDVSAAIVAVLTGLPANAPPMPLAASRWLAEVARHRLPPTALRAAIFFALHADRQWLGVDALGQRLGVDFRRASAATRTLVAAGLLERSTEGTRALYRRVFP